MILEGFREFTEYFMAFVENLWKQFKSFWVDLFELNKALFVTNTIDNFKLIGDHANKFNAISWILFVLIDGLVLLFFALLIIKIIQILARWLKFRKKEVNKEDLLFEIAKLKKEIIKVTREKDRILSLQVGGSFTGEDQLDYTPSLVNENDLLNREEPKAQLFYGDREGGGQVSQPSASYAGASEGAAAGGQEKPIDTGKRFAKLELVDEMYKDGNYVVTMNTQDMIGLPEIVNRFVNFAASQHRLYYSKKVISKFIAGLATSKIIILEGISGTGKTSLPYCFSRFVRNQATIVSVQPSWRDRTEILGYLNEFTKKFNETDFLKALYEVSYREDVNLIVLDELNLARIEYYFAEFLSVMEMPDKSEWKIDLVPTQLPSDPKHLAGGKLLIPQNCWYIGTANRDDSTFTITDKVYDRAVTLYLNERAQFFDAPFTDSINISFNYLENLFAEAAEKYPISLKSLKNIDQIDIFIQDNFKVAFGNRILKQIKLFVPVYVACGNSETDALDFMISSKIFKKFEALNLPFLRKELEGLIDLIQKLFGKDAFPESIAYLKDLLKMSS
ncbi:hypothetical protein IKQ02_02505 [bacterium]|nr:hypothetical protein [bacterium]